MSEIDELKNYVENLVLCIQAEVCQINGKIAASKQALAYAVATASKASPEFSQEFSKHLEWLLHEAPHEVTLAQFPQAFSSLRHATADQKLLDHENWLRGFVPTIQDVFSYVQIATQKIEE